MTTLAEHPVHQESTEDLVARARTAAKVVREQADEIEQTANVTDAAYEAIAEQGLYWLLLPGELGGPQRTFVDALKVIEQISRGDASAGWALAANVASSAVAAGFTSEEGAREIFGGARPGITAGMLLPNAKGVRVDGGYRVTGTFSFASGSAYADWIGAGFVVHDAEGNPITDGDGTPDCRIGWMRRSDVEFRANWDVLGLVGTGSHDYYLDEVFIPDHLSMETFSTDPVRDEPVFRLGLLGLGVGGHGAVVLGAAQAAMEEIAHLASTKSRPGYATVVADAEIFGIEFSRHDAELQAARLYLHAVHTAAENSAAADEPISDEQRARMRQAVTWVHDVAMEVANFAHRWGGSQALRNPSRLGRCLRDIAVARQHVVTDPVTLVDAAPLLIQGYRTAHGE